jgi:glycine/sarcosine N-methyltransferase
MYDDFSLDYDRFVAWPGRLAAELPFVIRELQSINARRVLDAACGTGRHAIALAQQGYDVTGADLSSGMIERARANAEAEGVDVHFTVAGFGELARHTQPPFDALLCLGNSLPHLLTSADLNAALSDFAACLRPGGLVLIQNRNFDAVLAQRERSVEPSAGRWMEPQFHREAEAEWLFLRFYDFEPDGLLTFNVVTLRRPAAGNWGQHVAAVRLWPLRQAEMTAALFSAGFEAITCYGAMSGAPFDPETSDNLIVTATWGDF